MFKERLTNQLSKQIRKYTVKVRVISLVSDVMHTQMKIANQRGSNHAFSCVHKI